MFVDYGFNCIKLADDWQGADFLAYHKDGESTLKVQLKGRVFIAEKYRGKGLYMVFPVDGVWHLTEHDAPLELVAQHTRWLQSDAWKDTGAYSAGAINKDLKRALAGHALT
ncbi:MAG: hypothetical protein WD382_09450 [Halofilum sp. (in: g-proteobacteria)]